MTIANLEKFCRLIKNNNDDLTSPPLPPAKLKVFSGLLVFSRRKSLLTTAVIFSRPRGVRGVTMEEGKLQIFFLILILLEKYTKERFKQDTALLFNSFYFTDVFINLLFAFRFVFYLLN